MPPSSARNTSNPHNTHTGCAAGFVRGLRAARGRALHSPRGWSGVVCQAQPGRGHIARQQVRPGCVRARAQASDIGALRALEWPRTPSWGMRAILERAQGAAGVSGCRRWPARRVRGSPPRWSHRRPSRALPAPGPQRYMRGCERALQGSSRTLEPADSTGSFLSCDACGAACSN